MTENEAIETLKIHRIFSYGSNAKVEAIDIAIKALEEIQQYRAIVTVKYFKECADILNKVEANELAKIIDEWLLYHKIGTVEECREARERQEPRLLNDREIAFIGKGTEIQSRCPQCGIILGIGISEKPIIPKEIRHCFNCGQKLYL